MTMGCGAIENFEHQKNQNLGEMILYILFVNFFCSFILKLNPQIIDLIRKLNIVILINFSSFTTLALAINMMQGHRKKGKMTFQFMLEIR
jgi:small neutral amino acid transporter SnatA (MarC family)